MTDAQWTHQIIGAAIEVHREPRPGLLESVHGYRTRVAVLDRLIVEVKAIVPVAPVYDAVTFACLRPSGCRTGRLLNFHTALLKDGMRR